MSFGQPIEPDRRLWSLQARIPGSLYVLRCLQCNHLAGMPVALLQQRFGPQSVLRTVLPRLKCGNCQQHSVEAIAMRLCEPGCAKQR